MQHLLIFPFFLVFYEMSNYLANDMYLPALPTIMQDLHMTAHSAQMTLTSFFLGSASMQLILGPVSDRIGRRPVLLGGGFIFLFATLVCMFTYNIFIFLLARFFQGLAVCSVQTAGYSSIHESFDTAKAVHILALMGSITVLAPAFGPLAGSLVLAFGHWRSIFTILFFWGAVGVFALYICMPESNPPSQRHALDWKLLLKNYRSIVCNRVFLRYTLIFCLAFLGLIAWITGGPFLIVDAFKKSPFYYGCLQAVIFLGLIIGAQCVKRIIDKVGVHELMNIGVLIILFSGITAFVVTLIFPHFLLGLVIALTLFAFGSGLVFAPASRLSVEACTEPMGTRMAVSSTIMCLFGVIGSLLVSITYTGTLFWFGSLLLIVSVLAFVVNKLSCYYQNEK